MIAVVDYGAGNLRSVVNAFRRLGYQPTVTSEPSEVLQAEAVILPGVGAAADTMTGLKRLGLIEPIVGYIADNRPFLGVCIGLQLLLTGSEEGGWHEGMNIVSGRVKRLPTELKTPHMGWNQVCQRRPHPIFRGVPDKANFYFVHSYYAEPDDKSLVAADTDYGVSFCSVLERDNLIGTQFHPEKSGETGLKIYENFLSLALDRD
jgi:glutamine amidotransferase